ncbi:hypothetical protein GWI33_018866 [Rhynchophorus ferrugineus]|uniref:Uncharacterized protein n=1 Tax=Rhynchophorus ferrugineus TaxID=354439 RepID=A0A834HX21_RHYFE|nr:hypothetical protein GWI33_018866 [Rhynchophorus ferrugineus]
MSQSAYIKNLNRSYTVSPRFAKYDRPGAASAPTVYRKHGDLHSLNTMCKKQFSGGRALRTKNGNIPVVVLDLLMHRKSAGPSIKFPVKKKHNAV